MCLHAALTLKPPCACGPSAIEDLVVELESSGEGTDVEFPRYAMVLLLYAGNTHDKTHGMMT